MKSKESRERTVYDASLSGIFFWSGLTVFIILLLACAVIGVTVFFSRRSDPEGIKIVLFALRWLCRVLWYSVYQSA